MLVYKGCEVRHWRKALPGPACIQTFLHYVVTDGPNYAERFDRRKHPGGAPDWEDARKCLVALGLGSGR